MHAATQTPCPSLSVSNMLPGASADHLWHLIEAGVCPQADDNNVILGGWTAGFSDAPAPSQTVTGVQRYTLGLPYLWCPSCTSGETRFMAQVTQRKASDPYYLCSLDCMQACMASQSRSSTTGCPPTSLQAPHCSPADPTLSSCCPLRLAHLTPACSSSHPQVQGRTAGAVTQGGW